jgi:hypothetical protein
VTKTETVLAQKAYQSAWTCTHGSGGYLRIAQEIGSPLDQDMESYVDGSLRLVLHTKETASEEGRMLNHFTNTVNWALFLSFMAPLEPEVDP